MPFLPKFNITNSITAALVKIERTRGFLEAARLSAGSSDKKDLTFY